MRNVTRLLIVVVLGINATATEAAGPSFTWLGDLDGGQAYSLATGVSADGSVVVGLGTTEEGRRAFRWTADGGLIDLGFSTPGLFFTEYFHYGYSPHISADGSTIVGERNTTDPYTEAVRWTEGEGVFGLGDLPGYQASSRAFHASSDGSVIVGTGVSEKGNEAFRWTEEDGLVGLGDLPGRGFISEARAISDDGSVIVGIGFSEVDVEAFRWTEQEGMVGLGYLPTDDEYESRAYEVSADGKVIVGVSSSGSAYAPFRWTEETGMVSLGEGTSLLDGAFGVSGDGSVIVGSLFSLGEESYEGAFIWDEIEGTRNLKNVLIDDYGLDLEGSILVSALNISDDGRTIVGFGARPGGGIEAWVAVVPEPSSFVLAGFAVVGFGLLAWRKRESS